MNPLLPCLRNNARTLSRSTNTRMYRMHPKEKPQTGHSAAPGDGCSTEVTKGRFFHVAPSGLHFSSENVFRCQLSIK